MLQQARSKSLRQLPHINWSVVILDWHWAPCCVCYSVYTHSVVV